MKCFMDTGSIVSDGALMLRWQIISMVFVGIVLLMTIICQSMGKVTFSFILSVSRQGVVFLIVLAPAYKIGGYTGIIASQAMADLITALIAGGLFFGKLRKEFR